jgi:hypothetical protein
MAPFVPLVPFAPKDASPAFMRTPSSIGSTRNIYDIADGSFEELRAMLAEAIATDTNSTGNQFLDTCLQIVADPDSVLSTLWNVTGNARLLTSVTNTLVELTHTEETSIAQLVSIDANSQRLEFDITVLNAGPSDILQIAFDGQTLQDFTLLDIPQNTRLSAPLVGRSGIGLLTFRMSGPTNQPAVVRLDNLTISYARPRLSSIEVLPDQTTKLRIEGSVGVRYAIEGSADLRSWMILDAPRSTNGVLEFMDAEASRLERRFYRVRVVP